VSAVVLVALPVVLVVKSQTGKQALLRWGSVAVFLVALLWLIERLFF
jgi:hypothetical protein